MSQDNSITIKIYMQMQQQNYCCKNKNINILIFIFYYFYFLRLVKANTRIKREQTQAKKIENKKPLYRQNINNYNALIK